ncbi:hypothetical protein SAMN05421881_105312, partial [Nitrosomonas halophila]
MIRLLVCFTVIGALFHSVSAAPQSFSEAKVQARQKVYYPNFVTLSQTSPIFQQVKIFNWSRLALRIFFCR